MLKDYPPFQANDFEYLRGRILILLPENDIFKKEDQKRFADLFRKLDAEIRTVPGGHVGFIVQAERYLDLMKTFLQLRLRKGLNLDEYKKRYGRELSTAQRAFVQNCVKSGYASFDGRTLALTPAGLIVQNSILAELL